MGKGRSMSQRGRRGSRSFKDRRALIACTRCRHLKKGCKQVGRERCERCCQTDQVCIYMDVANDPTAPRPPGSEPPIAVPDSPTNSPSDPPSPNFEIYHPFPSSTEEADGSQYAPHIIRSRNDINPIRSNPTPMPNVNALPTGPSIFSSSQNTGQPSSSLDSFPGQPPFATYSEDVYSYPTQDPYVQPPASFTAHSAPPDQDITDPPHSPHYLRPHPTPSPLSHNNVQAFTSANAMTPHIHYPNAAYLSPLSPADLSNTSDHHYTTVHSSPSHSPISYSSLSSYDLP